MRTPPYLIAGVDEVGRGPLAGPVVAAAVVLDPKRPVDGLADSKVLDELARQRLDQAVRAQALGFALGEASVEEIDSMNIYHATHLAMRRAIAGLLALGIHPSLVLVDGNKLPGSCCAESAIVKGDGRVACIGAASIIAKVARDASMDAWHQKLPAYGFDRHKGYGTPQHMAALDRHGVTPLHRRSFAPVRERAEAERVEA
jgi:ribonuclease HII